MTRRRYALRQAVHRYLREKRVQGLGEGSIEQLRSRLTDFVSSVSTDDPSKVGRGHVIRWMDRPGLTAAYQRSRLSAVRGFCQWCVVRGHMRKDPTAGLRLPRVAEAVPKRLTGDEVARLVEVAKGDGRLLLVVLLMLQEGLRRLEVARLNVEDVDASERTIAIRGKGGQGKRTAVLPISDETWSALGRYLADEGHRNGPLIRNRVRRSPRMAASTISDLVRAAMVEAGVKQPGDSSRTPHSCRHTMAQDVLEATGGNVRAVQQALRHASVRSSEIYLRGNVTDLRAIMAGREYLTDREP